MVFINVSIPPINNPNFRFPLIIQLTRNVIEVAITRHMSVLTNVSL